MMTDQTNTYSYVLLDKQAKEINELSNDLQMSKSRIIRLLLQNSLENNPKKIILESLMSDE